MTEQGQKLMAMIGTAVANLHRLGDIVPAVRDLGKRHGGYGVKDADYDTVAGALLWTLEQGLGADFTPATRDAWVACYGVLARRNEDRRGGNVVDHAAAGAARRGCKPSISMRSPSATRMETTSARVCSPITVMQWVRSRSAPSPVT